MCIGRCAPCDALVSDCYGEHVLLQVACWVVFAVGVLLMLGHHMSMVPPLGAVLVFVACTQLPIGWRLGAIAFVIDPALPAIVIAFVLMPLWSAAIEVRDRFRRSTR